MEDQKNKEKTIDLVRRRMENVRDVRCKTDEERRGVEDILEVLNINDYIFFNLSQDAVKKVLGLVCTTEEEAICIYRKLVSPEQLAEYKRYLRKQRIEKVKTVIDRLFGGKRHNRHSEK